MTDTRLTPERILAAEQAIGGLSGPGYRPQRETLHAALCLAARASGEMNPECSEYVHYFDALLDDGACRCGKVRRALAAQPAPASGGEPDAWAVLAANGFVTMAHQQKGVVDADCAHMNENYHSPKDPFYPRTVIPLFRHPPASGTGSEDTAAPQEFVCYCGHPTSRHGIRHSALAACYDCGCHRFRAPSDQGERT